MTMVIAPPPAAIAQLTDLIALFRNLDQAEKLVKDLQAAADKYNKAVAAASKERAAADASLAQIEEAQQKADQSIAASDKKLVKLAGDRMEAAWKDAGLPILPRWFLPTQKDGPGRDSFEGEGLEPAQNAAGRLVGQGS